MTRADSASGVEFRIRTALGPWCHRTRHTLRRCIARIDLFVTTLDVSLEFGADFGEVAAWHEPLKRLRVHVGVSENRGP